MKTPDTRRDFNSTRFCPLTLNCIGLEDQRVYTVESVAVAANFRRRAAVE